MPEFYPAVSIVSALSLWREWHVSIAPSGPCGDAAADRKLADAFRALIACPDADARLRWIEGNVFSGDHFPSPEEPTDLFRSQLMRWWMDIYDEMTAAQRLTE